jgi:hypothetical protein
MVAALPPDRFLTALHKMFERTKAKGAVTLTTKRSAFLFLFVARHRRRKAHAHLSTHALVQLNTSNSKHSQHEEQTGPQA